MDLTQARVIETPDDCTYEPWTDGHAVGFKCTRPSDGAVTFIYLNPSSESDDGQPNVFVYTGAHGNPAQDAPAHFYDIEFA
jgi:hypothetical protein